MNFFTSKIPSLIYGTAWKKERTAELVEKAVTCGFQGIDTACQPKHYNEAGVGEALKHLKALGITRENLFLQTKFTPLAGQDPARVPYDVNADIKEQVCQSTFASLKNLGVDNLDALLLHSPLPTFEETMEAWRALEELQKKGLIKRLGISNCYDLATFRSIYEKASIKPSILQNRFYAETDYDKTLRLWTCEKNIAYQGFWTLTANPHVLRHPLLCQLSSTRKVTPEQLFFRFLTQKQIIPLIGSCSEKHMQEDLAIFDFPLSIDEMEQIESLLI